MMLFIIEISSNVAHSTEAIATARHEVDQGQGSKRQKLER